MALSTDTLEEVVKPHLRQKYILEKNDWFPRIDTPNMLPTTRGPPGSSKKSTEEMELLPCVAGPTTV
jgi:hypothetical protein